MSDNAEYDNIHVHKPENNVLKELENNLLIDELENLPKYLCENWSKINRQCKLTYVGTYINKLDLKKGCKGVAAIIECSWIRTKFYQRPIDKEICHVR